MSGFDRRWFRGFSSPEFAPTRGDNGGASCPSTQQCSSPVSRSSGWVACSSRAAAGTLNRERERQKRERELMEGERARMREKLRV
ncbi:hypothetical protein PanWU01x14_132490 [Parasponia andersonii]|uniref:Uncharacterized protein n=1 Tax=Parasponia andersonii TaxID=3476 RepID=A0A2P5CQK6_PARAD|nr:hypothetical protein PanWU01x14_132490 [Parasponia andersonii]